MKNVKKKKKVNCFFSHSIQKWNHISFELDGSASVTSKLGTKTIAIVWIELQSKVLFAISHHVSGNSYNGIHAPVSQNRSRNIFNVRCFQHAFMSQRRKAMTLSFCNACQLKIPAITSFLFFSHFPKNEKERQEDVLTASWCFISLHTGIKKMYSFY